MAKWDWTAEHDDVLRNGIREDRGVGEIATLIGCKPHQVYVRSRTLGLKWADRRMKVVAATTGGFGADSDAPYWSQNKIDDMNAAFNEAMLSAIKNGREHAPIGVERAACTKRPVMIHAGLLPARSIAADVAEFAANPRGAAFA